MSNIITTSATADDVASVLADAGLALIVGTNLFVNKELDSPHECVTVYDTTAFRAPEINYNWECPAVQVRVRRQAGDYRTGKLFVIRLMNALHGYVGTVGSIKYHGIVVVNGPIPLGEDEKGRPRWTFNCNIQRSN